MGGASAPTLSAQIPLQFHRAGSKGVGPEGPPTKDFAVAQAAGYRASASVSSGPPLSARTKPFRDRLRGASEAGAVTRLSQLERAG
ncbi:DUF6053 domain-containing protein [Lysobacter sp. CA199]|uniref:DUF6053 domain-containing protein n=1 Tax=Lysobacter sp. CA199 TaxID=3455608 RepID=UPI003F8D158C